MNCKPMNVCSNDELLSHFIKGSLCCSSALCDNVFWQGWISLIHYVFKQVMLSQTVPVFLHSACVSVVNFVPSNLLSSFQSLFFTFSCLLNLTVSFLITQQGCMWEPVCPSGLMVFDSESGQSRTKSVRCPIVRLAWAITVDLQRASGRPAPLFPGTAFS